MSIIPANLVLSNFVKWIVTFDLFAGIFLNQNKKPK